MGMRIYINVSLECGRMWKKKVYLCIYTGSSLSALHFRK